MTKEKEIAVAVRDIHKEFILPQSKNTTFKQVAVNIVKRNNKVTQKVLDGIDFEIFKGDFFGIVGRNGSGKSTLLKLLAGVYTPTRGNIQVDGGLTPFIELGVGFNPELSGRDNVYLNGALLGFDRRQMDDMYEEIVDFAELEQFMDQKLKNYSSGMQVRLAFSIAIKAKNDILIFDEVLAVGDEAFQRKCLDVFEKYKAEGQTVVLVTHDMETVRQFCTRAALISDGRLVKLGNPQKVTELYTKLNNDSIISDIANHKVDSELIIGYEDTTGKESFDFKTGETIRIQLKSDVPIKSDFFVINIYKRSGEHITGFRVPAGNSIAVDVAAYFAKGKYSTLIQQITRTDEVIGDSVLGPEFYITTDQAEGIPGWSGLVPVEHRVVE